MPDKSSPSLSGVAETLLIPLYIRALESRRPDALLHDERAVALVERLEPEFDPIKQIRMDEDDRVALVMRNREFDRQAMFFLARFPEAVVVHIGCGLDTRFERVDNGLVTWYDLDLPQVIELRRELIGGENERYHLLACSAFDPAWMDKVSERLPRPYLFLAEGVFMYFKEAQIKALVLALQKRFPGAELVFDAFQPFMVHANNLRLRISKADLSARYQWGLKRGSDLADWGPGLQLLSEWFPFDCREPRLAHIEWMRHIPPLAHVMGVYHFRLGERNG